MKLRTDQPAPTMVTLGPPGTCHERATHAYMKFQGITDYAVEFIEDFSDGLDLIRDSENAFLLQCSAHPRVHEITERYWRQVFAVDTFLYPTKPLAVLSRRDVARPRTLGLVPATAGYIAEEEWEEIIDVVSKPIVAQGLLEGQYEAGLTHLEYAARHPDQLRIDQEIGEIDTTWIVYGTRKRFKGKLIGISSPEIFEDLRPPGDITGGRFERGSQVTS